MRDLKCLVVYIINLAGYGHALGTTKCSMINEHRKHCNMSYNEKCSMAEHFIQNKDHSILFNNMETLSNKQTLLLSSL